MVWNPQSKSCEFRWDGRCVELKFVHFSDVFVCVCVSEFSRPVIIETPCSQLAGEVDASFASCAIHGHGMQWGS